ncbi:MAG: hypothetical protein EBS53_08995 [Bacteroidetes bacterium]|nr:hypothetical protein [Bacteroidota bacterium]
MLALEYRLPAPRWDPWLLGSWAVGCELIGRILFPNWDVSYALYGARFWMDRGGPWMNVWPGLDLFLGSLARLTGQPELAITIVGVLLNVAVTLLVWGLGRRLELDRGMGLCAALATGLWFKPPVGGWVGDHLSYCVALMPALLLALGGGHWSRRLGLISGGCFAYGLTLKLNNSGPGLLISALWMTLVLLGRNSWRWPQPRALFKGVAWVSLGAFGTGILLDKLTLLPGGLFQQIGRTYAVVLHSHAAEQAAWQKLLQLPLQIQYAEALRLSQGGVLIFMPLVFGFWIALGWSIYQLRKGGDSGLRHASALLLLLSSALVGLSLGRGLTHRLFLLPAGLILSFGDFPWPINWRRFFALGLLGYLLSTWLSFAWVQRGAELAGGYNSRLLLADNRPVMLCLGSPLGENTGSLVIQGEWLSTDNNRATHCWSAKQVAEQFAGLVDVQMLANQLGVSFRNQQIGAGDFREKWDWRQSTPNGRYQWVAEQAARINQLKLPYLLERLPLNSAELEIPAFTSWAKPRLQQQQDLAKALGATPIGRFGEITLWRTRWGQN